ncbi:MAG: hypothetical protein HYX92_02655 [Chloroflexi bacterium]|nr:hypothetical protein [Chloroflexota bacterium]
MPSNLDRYKKDLDCLIDSGQQLRLSFQREVKWEEPTQDEQEPGSIFRRGYQRWYSEARALVKQILPDRLQEFDRLYDEGKNQGLREIATYSIKDWLLGIDAPIGKDHASRWVKLFDDRGTALRRFQAQVQIVEATRARFESTLFDIRQMLQADVFDSEIEAARELLKNGFLRAAGAVAGVVLEKHLGQVCQSHGVTLSKRDPHIGDFNDALKKDAVIDTPTWRFIQRLADLRNLCDHSKDREPKPEEVAELIDGVDRMMKSVS